MAVEEKEAILNVMKQSIKVFIGQTVLMYQGEDMMGISVGLEDMRNNMKSFPELKKNDIAKAYDFIRLYLHAPIIGRNQMKMVLDKMCENHHLNFHILWNRAKHTNIITATKSKAESDKAIDGYFEKLGIK